MLRCARPRVHNHNIIARFAADLHQGCLPSKPFNWLPDGGPIAQLTDSIDIEQAAYDLVIES